MSRNNNSIYLIASSIPHHDNNITKIAQRLGEQIADEKLTLIYSGGLEGIAGLVAREAFNRHAKVRAIVTSREQDAEQLNGLLPEVVKSDSARIDRVLRDETVKGVLVLPGDASVMSDALSFMNHADKNGGPPVLLGSMPELNGIRQYFKTAIETGLMNPESEHLVRNWTSPQSLRVSLQIPTRFGYRAELESHVG